MTLRLAASLSALALCLGCGPTGPDLCAEVTCPIAGTMCAPADGMCHCGALTGPVCADGYACDEAASACEVEAICPGTGRWAPGERAFEEITDAAGLTGILGVRMSAIDYDGDGWTDLFVRDPSGWDDFTEGGARFSWLLRNRGDGTFEDVTQASGILTPRTGAAGGRPVEVHAFGDVDGDGDLDVYLGVSTVDATRTMGETSEIMIQQPDHTFVLGPEGSAVRLVGEYDSVASASFTDVDLDGDLDLWTPHHGFASGSSFNFEPDHLYLNDGAGTFSDVTGSVGLTTAEWSALATINAAQAHSRAWAGHACDLNDDGYPELLAASYGRAPNHLWQAGGATLGYTNRSVESGYAYDENLTWQDDQFARCFCAANRSAEGCAEVPAPMVGCGTPNWDHETGREPFRLGGNSGTTSCGDVDNDGDLDLLTSEIAHWWAGPGSDGAELMVNAGTPDVTFTRPGRAAMSLMIPHDDPSGWNEGIMTNAIFDFDNDGWLDLFFGMSDYPGNHAALFHQVSPLSFEPVAITDGIDHHRSHGVAIADFDRDGDLDVVLGHSTARCSPPTGFDDCYASRQIRMFDNLLGGNFVSIALRGTTANRSAIGARLTIEAGGVTMTREVEGGHGHYGLQDDLVQHIGLGDACEATVSVRWPVAGLPVQVFTVAAGHRYAVTQDGEPMLADVVAP